MQVGIKECVKCGRSYKTEMFPQTNSRFIPSGRADLCMNCIETMIDGENFEDVDKVCQWLDYPLLMGEWMKLYKIYRSKTFRNYSEMFCSGNFDGEVEWREMNDRLKKAVGEGTVSELVPEFDEQWMNEMAAKYQMEASAEDFRHLEFLYEDLMRTQNIVTGTQKDAALKMCKLSLLADKAIRMGEVPKDLLKTYNDLAKANDFTPKNAKNAGDFDSCGEVFLWLEKRGWNRKFYDNIPTDVVDVTMKNVQNYLRRLVLGESNLAEEVERRLEALNNFEVEDDSDEFTFSDAAKEDAEAMALMDEEENEEFHI